LVRSATEKKITTSCHVYTEVQPTKGSSSVTRMIKNRLNSAPVQRYWKRRKTCPSTLLFFTHTQKKNPRVLPLKRAHADGNLSVQLQKAGLFSFAAIRSNSNLHVMQSAFASSHLPLSDVPVTKKQGKVNTLTL